MVVAQILNHYTLELNEVIDQPCGGVCANIVCGRSVHGSQIRGVVNVPVPYLRGKIGHNAVERIAHGMACRILAHHRRADHQLQRVKGELTAVPIGVGHGRGLQDTVVVGCDITLV
jgi:hypothetical protein